MLHYRHVTVTDTLRCAVYGLPEPLSWMGLKQCAVQSQGWPWLRWLRARLGSVEVRGALQLLQFASSVVFVCLYVASTYRCSAAASSIALFLVS